jgi:hypothetical protein
MVDIRSLYSYINLYTYDRDWRIVLLVTETKTKESYKLYLNSWLAAPTGYFHSKNDQFIFT